MIRPQFHRFLRDLKELGAKLVLSSDQPFKPLSRHADGAAQAERHSERTSFFTPAQCLELLFLMTEGADDFLVPLGRLLVLAEEPSHSMLDELALAVNLHFTVIFVIFFEFS